MPDPLSRSMREKIAAGLLPSGPPSKLWAGYGTNRPCDGCGRPVTRTELEHELDFPDGRTVRFHAACSETWRRATTGGLSGPDEPAADGTPATG